MQMYCSEMGRPSWCISLLLLLAELRPSLCESRNLFEIDFPHGECVVGAPPPKQPAWSGDMDSFFDYYRPLHEIDRYIDKLHDRWPHLTAIHTIGRSSEGRPLRMLEISDGKTVSAERPCVILQGGIHAREWIATATVLFIAGQLLNQSNFNNISNLLGRYVFALIAPLNPDGYIYSWEADRMWRKTRSNLTHRDACPQSVGVDPNRNWGYTWGKTSDANYEKSLHDPCTDVFIGGYPFSEPEVKAMSSYMRKRQVRSLTRDFLGRASVGSGFVAAFLDFHSNAQMLLPPWAFTASLPTSSDGEYVKGLCYVMSTAIQNYSGQDFPAGADLLPPDPGTGPDWAYGELGIRGSMTVELEDAQHGFCLPRQEIRSVGMEQLFAVLAMMQYLDSNGASPSSRQGMFAETEVGMNVLACIGGLAASALLVGACLLYYCTVVKRQRVQRVAQREPAYTEMVIS